jgi:hypothetical protein
MTIAIAWIRTIRDCQELVFVTDSRLSGDGRNFDACPKVITLPRSDCAIAFAGYTGHAYPMMQQLSYAIDAHGPLQRGSMDINALKTHTLKIFDSMSDQIFSSDRVAGDVDTTPEAEFIFGGYSWIKKKFEIWKISFQNTEKRFIAQPASSISYSPKTERTEDGKFETKEMYSPGEIVFAGDQAGIAKNLLARRFRSDASTTINKKFDMEPFEVVRDMLRNENHSETIGGAPQIIKVYQYMKSAPLGVFWPQKSEGRIHLHGRPCLGYEHIDRWVLDPDTLFSERTLPTREAEFSDRINSDATDVAEKPNNEPQIATI